VASSGRSPSTDASTIERFARSPPNATLMAFAAAELRRVGGGFTQFSGAPQCVLTAEQLLAELSAAGFAPAPALPLREHNRRCVATIPGPPVIYEGGFRRDDRR
jgi:hypothetical protein